MARPENFDPDADYPVTLTLAQLVVLHIILRRARGCPIKSPMKHINNILPRITETLIKEGILVIEPSGQHLYAGEDLDQYITGEIPLHDVPDELSYLLE